LWDVRCKRSFFPFLLLRVICFNQFHHIDPVVWNELITIVNKAAIFLTHNLVSSRRVQILLIVSRQFRYVSSHVSQQYSKSVLHWMSNYHIEQSSSNDPHFNPSDFYCKTKIQPKILINNILILILCNLFNSWRELLLLRLV
jgi:hypothetical protein